MQLTYSLLFDPGNGNRFQEENLTLTGAKAKCENLNAVPSINLPDTETITALRWVDTKHLPFLVEDKHWTTEQVEEARAQMNAITFPHEMIIERNGLYNGGAALRDQFGVIWSQTFFEFE